MAGGKTTTEHLKQLGIPPVHWHARLDTIPDHACPWKPRLREYVDAIAENVSRPRGLLLHGIHSTGKSAAAAICLKAAACHRVYGFWQVADSLGSEVMDDVTWEGKPILEHCLGVPVLVLDNLRLTREPKRLGGVVWRDRLADELVRARVDARLCTIVTTEYTTEEVKNLFPSLGAVLMEAVVPVRVYGYDFRRQIAQELA
jgi:hypothetical protein